MDALKKAERARAARQDDSAASEGEAPLSLDPIEARPLAAEGAAESEQNARAADLEDSLEIDLDDTRGARRPRLELEPESELPELDVDAEEPRSRPPPRRRAGEQTDGLEFPDPLDQTAATLPSLKAARDSVNSYFDGGSSASLSMDGVVSSEDDTTITGQRASVEREAQEAARAVFTAKTPVRRSGSAARWGLFVGLPLVLGIAAVGMYYYWLEAGARSGGFASRQWTTGSGTVTPSRPRAPASLPAPSAPAPPLAATVTNPPSAAAPDAGTGVSAAAAAPSSGDLTPRLEPEPPARAAPAPAPAVPTGPPVLSDAQFEEMLARASPVPPGFSSGGGIKVTRHAARNPLGELLPRAYSAYQRGDLEAARREYSAALEREPKNRDALLGLAAIAVRSGAAERARTLYQEVLTSYPRDSVALAGWLQLAEGIDPVAGEAELRTMLRREPTAGHLYFSLGNLYAAQARWSEAQSAYFEAYRTESRNPDYSFNLAVSLDQIGQQAAALQYYRTALELSDGKVIAFDASEVLQRIRTISAR